MLNFSKYNPSLIRKRTKISIEKKKKALQRTGKCEHREGVNGMFPLNTG